MAGKKGSSGGGNKGKGKCMAWLREHANHASTNCLKYPFAINSTTGYGTLGYMGKMMYAHRVMCEFKNGPPPSPQAEAAHTCGNGHMGCVNPNHLIWKTHQQNAQDRLAHGNYSLRKGVPRFLLTPEKAAQIKALKGQKTQFELAEMFGVSRCTISSIHCGRGWTGEGRKSRPFTPEEVSDILSRRPGATLQALADEYGVKISTMQRICAGKTYKYQDA